MTPEEKFAAMLQPAEFQTRPLSVRERQYFGLRLRRVEQRWTKAWRFEVIYSSVVFIACLLGMYFTKEFHWGVAFFFLGLCVFYLALKVPWQFRDYRFERRQVLGLLAAGNCEELHVTTYEVWVIENLQYGTCWYACAVDDAQVMLIDGGQYDFFPRLPATEFSLRVYKLANGNVVEPRIIPYGERIAPAREFSCGFTNSILDQAAYNYSGSLQSFCQAMRSTGIDLEETCPANKS